MGKRFYISVIATMIISLSNAVYAETYGIAMGGAYKGGDQLISADPYDLDAGNGIFIGGGVLVIPENSALSYQVVFGLKFYAVEYDGYPGSDGTATLDSFPVELTMYYTMNRFRLGGGITYHLNPEYEKCPDVGSCSSVQFDDALGYIAEFVIDTSNGNMFLGLRYTAIDYEIGNTTLSADNLGLNVGFKF